MRPSPAELEGWRPMRDAPRNGFAIVARRERDGVALLVRWAREQVSPPYGGAGSSGGGPARFANGRQSRNLPGLFEDRTFSGWTEPEQFV